MLAALVAWMSVYYTLQHMMSNLDGSDRPEPSLMERAVSYLSK